MATISFKHVIFMMHNHLSLSKSTIQFSVSASSPSSCSFTVDYLTNSCGFTLQSAISTSKKLEVNENNIERSDAVISLFKSYGFDDTHIADIIRKVPVVLNGYKVEENLKPKLEFLVENGFSGPVLHDLIVGCPRILGTSLSQRIKPSIGFLRSFLGTEERLKLAVKRNPRLLSNNLKATLQPNINLLLEEGVPLHALTNFLVSRPTRLQPKVDRLVSALKMVKDVLNMRPTDPVFLLAVTMTACIDASLWETKLQVLRSFGFSRDEVLSIFKRRPECLGLSVDKIRSKLSFYFDIVKLEIDDIMSYPTLLANGIETSVRPRHNVLKILMSKDLLKKDTRIAYIFTRGEGEFLTNYVTPYLEELPSLLDMYYNDKALKNAGID